MIHPQKYRGVGGVIYQFSPVCSLIYRAQKERYKEMNTRGGWLEDAPQ